VSRYVGARGSCDEIDGVLAFDQRDAANSSDVCCIFLFCWMGGAMIGASTDGQAESLASLMAGIFALIAGYLAFRGGERQASAIQMASESTLHAKRGDDALLAAIGFEASIGRFQSAFERDPVEFDKSKYYSEMHEALLEFRKLYSLARRSYKRLSMELLNNLYNMLDLLKK
jgi:hypothetical protein